MVVVVVMVVVQISDSVCCDIFLSSRPYGAYLILTAIAAPLFLTGQCPPPGLHYVVSIYVVPIVLF